MRSRLRTPCSCRPRSRFGTCVVRPRHQHLRGCEGLGATEYHLEDVVVVGLRVHRARRGGAFASLWWWRGSDGRRRGLRRRRRRRRHRRRWSWSSCQATRSSSWSVPGRDHRIRLDRGMPEPGELRTAENELGKVPRSRPSHCHLECLAGLVLDPRTQMEAARLRCKRVGALAALRQPEHDLEPSAVGPLVGARTTRGRDTRACEPGRRQGARSREEDEQECHRASLQIVVFRAAGPKPGQRRWEPERRIPPVGGFGGAPRSRRDLERLT